MYTILLYVAVSAVGIETGWQRLPDGGMEYIIQLDQAALDALRRGSPVGSDIPLEAGEIRSYRIEFGNKPLPREEPLQPPKNLATQEPVKPLAEKSVFLTEPAKSSERQENSKPNSSTVSSTNGPSAKKPWLPLVLALSGLVASLAGNIYLGWIAHDSRRAYLQIAQQFNQSHCNQTHDLLQQ